MLCEHLSIRRVPFGVVLSRLLFGDRLADASSLPTGIVPLQPLANGKVALGPSQLTGGLRPALVLMFYAPRRPSARFPHQRRKKRREMDDGLAEGGPQRSSE